MNRIVAWRVASIVVLLGLWEATSRLLSSLFFPPPSEVMQRFVAEYVTGDAVTVHVIPGLLRFGAGFVVAVLAGVGLGVVFGLRPVVREVFSPILEFGRAVPPPLVLGVFLIAFGTGSLPKIALIGFGAVWPVLFNTIEGVAAVGEDRRDIGRVFAIPKWRRLQKMILPGAGPYIFAGLRISLSIALIMMVLTEFIGATNGLGFQLVRAWRSFAYLDMWAALTMVAIIGLTVNAGLVAVEKRVLAWHHVQNA
ncbi:MAG: ABC transporter permease [Acidimicrobiia bacterium]|nr:ABC transporter permease [Acidimicrobiia bacterium]NNK91858.1 ABC transporter permease [Acidimicrobiia bacterium]